MSDKTSSKTQDLIKAIARTKTEKEFTEVLRQAASGTVEELKVSLNAKRIKDLEQAYNKLQECILGDEVSISYGLFSLSAGIGCVSIEGNAITCDNAESFAEVAGLATNMEVYPLVNNRIRLTFAF